MKKFKVGFIGTGARSCSYGSAYAKSDEIDVVAVADPNAENRRLMLDTTGLTEQQPAQYSDWRELYEKHPDLNGIVISSPNYLHRDHAIPFINNKIAVALEKPMTTTMEDSEAILNAVHENNGQLLMGFVLRSTNYNRKINELVEADEIGRILSMQADELGSFGVSSVISRQSWRRYTATSGGSMMEKSSHDLDLLSWFARSRPIAVNSFGGSLLFKPNPLLPKRCCDCVHHECPYYDMPEYFKTAGDNILQRFIGKDDGLCIYNIDKDVFDNQAVSIQYDNGTIANFMLGFNCSGTRSGRNFHAIGTRGRIWGNIEQNELWIWRNSEKKAEKLEIPVTSSGHNGGDEKHALELLKMMRDSSYRPSQDAYAGYVSGAICIAADVSAREGRQVRFRYGAKGFITFE